MYNIYHFFESLIKVRPELASVAKLQEYHFNSVPLAYRDNATFPSLILRMHKGYPWPGGEFVEIIDSDSYNVPPFESHIPTGAMSCDMLGHDRKTKIYKSMQAAGEVPGWIHERQVYYLIRGRNNGNSKICLAHGRFFETTVKPKYVVRQALEEVFAGCVEEQALSQDQFDLLWHKLTQEIFSGEVRQVSIGAVEISLGIKTNANLGANLLSPFYYPELNDNTLNFVIPNYPADKHEHQLRELRWTLSTHILNQGEQFNISHPRWGDFFVLSYAL